MMYKKGDEVTIAHYSGVLNPETVWIVIQTNKNLVYVRVKDSEDNRGLLGFSNRSWFNVEQLRPVDCRCTIVGEDDGGTTCWIHHDCSDGSCTHAE